MDPALAPFAEPLRQAPGGRERRTTSRQGWRRTLPLGNDNDNGPAPGARPPAKRRVTLEQLLHWAYAEQRVHRYLRKPLDFFLWESDRDGLVANPRDMKPVHPDAVTVHRAVLGLYPDWLETISFRIFGEAGRAGAVIAAAETGGWPARLDATPRPVPIEPPSRAENYGWHIGADGDRHDYWIRSAGTVVLDEEEWARLQQDRKRHDYWIRSARHVEPDERKYPEWARRKAERAPGLWALVETPYCPIAWSPDPEAIAAADRQVEAWGWARAELHRTLAGAELRAHVLVAS